MNMQSKPMAEKSETIETDTRRLAFRNAMARLGAAVHIVTTEGPAGTAGFAATAVCSVTDNPPTLLVCLNRSSSAHKAVLENGVVCVNTLEAGHEQLSRRFGGGLPMAERFGDETWERLETGSPVLQQALISFDCRISRVADGGTHDILICEVEAIRLNETGRPLVYFDRGYHRL